MNKNTKTIVEIKKNLAEELTILAHHYQSDAIVDQADITGDSLELARKIDALEARHVVFCGVYFMAETAAILRRPDQVIHIPDTDASCPLADMAPARQVKEVLNKLAAQGRKVIPLAYVNSSAEVKQACGLHGGSVCTSANAETMLEWALSQGDGVLFLPDRNLGWNTAETLGIPISARHMLDIESPNTKPASQADLLLWPGYCPAHELFTPELVRAIRDNDPEALVVVHPECPPETVSLCDASGSTSFIIRYVEQAPDGSTIHIGTETNMVNRLAALYAGKKKIVPVKVSLCEDMGKITEKKLAATLTNLETGKPVDVPDDIRQPAKLALERMLKACE